MTTLAELKVHWPTPSAAIQSMYDGLTKLVDNKTLHVDMGCFGILLKSGERLEVCYGDPHRALCYGCAATAAVIDKLGIDSIRGSRWVRPGPETDAMLCRFEIAIDQFRCGRIVDLLHLYDVPWTQDMLNEIGAKELNMETWSYKAQLPMVLDIIKRLKALNL